MMKNPQYEETISDLIRITMPSIVFKTVYEKVFIAKEAKNAVTSALDACTCDVLLNVLLDAGCNSNSRILQENSYAYCGLFVKNVDSSYLGKALDKDGNHAIVKLVNQLMIGADAMAKIKKASVETLKNLNSKLQSGEPLTMEKLLQISFAKKAEDG